MDTKQSRDHGLVVCTPKFLPREKWLEAAENAARVNPKNLPDGTRPSDVVAAKGDRLALDLQRYWGSGVVRLTVGFLDNPSTALRSRILLHMNAWSRTANVTFIESATDPEVRISRAGGGYWSYLGTDILLIDQDEPTMNLQDFTMDTLDSEFYRVVRHEAGHTLGLPHEHMRTELIAKLDREKVIASFMASQSWSRQEVIDQILTPLEETSLLGTEQPDPNSIMCYQLPGDITLDGEPIPGGVDITQLDYDFVSTLYPKPGADPSAP